MGSNRRKRNWPLTGCAKNVDIIKVSVSRGGALWRIDGGGREGIRISLGRVSSRCSRFTKDDRGRLFRRSVGDPFEIRRVGGWLARSPLWLVKMTDVHRNGSLSRSTRRRGGGITMVGPDSGIICFEFICLPYFVSLRFVRMVRFDRESDRFVYRILFFLFVS